EVMARCDATEHIYRIAAKMFCDSTGDSRLGLEVGAKLRLGREARSEFNESLALEKADDATLGSSLLFTSRDYGRPMPFTPPRWARKVTRKHLRFRSVRYWDYGYWWIEWGGDRDTIGDQERIRFELMSIVMGVWDYIKNSGNHPSSANWAMDWVGFLPGKRGSRRMEGDHVLTEHDLLRGDIEDAVAIGGWPMDDHPPAGFDRPQLPPNRNGAVPVPYNIPLRSLYSKNIENLMMAGRNISCSHVAYTSTRVMGTCSVAGQAVGTAAAMCVRDDVTPRGIYENKALLNELQQTLLRDDQTIRHRTNTDPKDLARKAAVTCSGEDGEARAALVIDGHLRDYPHREKGKPKEIHHWERKLESEGAWIELSWTEPQRIREIQITFDTGFKRFLRLSASKRVREATIRAPQPETVRDYKVLYRAAGASGLAELATVEGNYQRVNRHRVEPVEAESVRIHVLADNGDPAARICEIRCYGGEETNRPPRWVAADRE
ncbi:MAG: FAD-dependent oxidoreductase, partial [bacterium]|nr:FAD-dependent oxidoreductase [bacterium]